jgi:hypothetical protein
LLKRTYSGGSDKHTYWGFRFERSIGDGENKCPGFTVGNSKGFRFKVAAAKLFGESFIGWRLA